MSALATNMINELGQFRNCNITIVDRKSLRIHETIDSGLELHCAVIGVTSQVGWIQPSQISHDMRLHWRLLDQSLDEDFQENPSVTPKLQDFAWVDR